MSSIMNKIKGKKRAKPKSGSAPSQGNQQPTYSILPHPAKTNDPRDLEPPQQGGGLNNNNPGSGAFRAREPYVPPPHIQNNLPPPKSREELRARQEELNRG